jgi:hypothetical protein
LRNFKVDTSKKNQTNVTNTNTTHPSNATQNGTKVNTINPNGNNTNATNFTSPKNVTKPIVPALPSNSSNLNSSARILVPTGPLPANNSNDIPCPEEKPFYNGTGCIQCNAPNNLFNTSTKTCTACPRQYEFN